MRNWSCTAISSRGARLPALLLATLLLAGCTHLFFLPMRQQVLSPAQLQLDAQDVNLVSADGTRLFAWHLRAAQPRGIVCFFHGNAENISTHIVNVAWLPAAGYEVLLLDYRGYGGSAGKPDLPGALADVRAGLDWCLARGRESRLPAYAFGQSLGAALTLEVAAEPAYRTQLAGVVADSSFAGYRRIARQALSGSWLLWPLQYPLSWLVTADHDPLVAVAGRGALPLLLMHSRDDNIIPFAHGELLREAAAAPACFLATSGPHNAALGPLSAGGPGYRQSFVEFMAAAAAWRREGSGGTDDSGDRHRTLPCPVGTATTSTVRAVGG